MNAFSTIRQFGSLATSVAALGLMLAVTEPVMSAELIKSGTFYGQSDHITKGTVMIEKRDGKTLVTLSEDFYLDGAPAPTLGFSNKGKFQPLTEFSKLKSLRGKQVYELPAGIMAAAFDTFTVWCSKFSVPLGSAKLS